MGSTFECILIIFLYTLLVKGHAQCELKDITVGTERTDRQVQGKQEWNVSFINTCNCPQKSLTVSCHGFQSTERVDPKLFAPVGNTNCIVNDGGPIGPSASIGFLYAWDPPFIFVPVSSQVQCG